MLWFEKVEVRQAAAFRAPGFEVGDLVPGINVIYGPNASGKTTFARSLEKMLWPGESTLQRAELLASVQVGGHRWQVEIQGNRVVTQREGVDAKGRLPVAPAENRDRYYLSLHDLLEAENRSFAEAIMRESVGGYDVGQAAQNLGFSEQNPRVGRATKAVEEAKIAWKEAQKAQEGLYGEEVRLRELTQEIEANDEKGRRKALIEGAILFREAHQAWEGAKQKVGGFDRRMAKVSGDEEQVVEGLREEIRSAAARLAEAREVIRAGEEVLRESSMPEDGLPTDFAGVERRRIADLKRLEEEEASLMRELGRYEKARDEAWLLIGEIGGIEEIGPIGFEDLRRVEKLAREADELRAQKSAMAALEDLLAGTKGGDKGDRDEGDEEEAIRLLQRWLRSPQVGGSVIARGILLLSAIIVAVISVALAMVVAAGWIALLMMAVALIWVLWALRKEVAADRREALQQEFEALGVSPPEGWEVGAVEGRLRRILQVRAEALVEAERSNRWASKRQEREALQARVSRFNEEARGLAADLGISLQDVVAREPARLFWLVNHLSDWQSAQGAVRAKEAELEQAREQIRKLLGGIGTAFSPFGVEAPRDAAEASARLELLVQEARDVEATKERLKRARGEVSKVARQKEEAVAAFEEVFSRLELEPGDDRELAKLCESLPGYRSALETLGDKKAIVEETRRRLRETAGFEEGLFERSLRALREELEAIETALVSGVELIEERQDILTRIDGAKKSHDVERTWAEYERSLENLRRHRQESYEKSLGHQLAEYLREETRDRERPEVFHRASELFAEITRGRYRLSFEEGNRPGFRAIDQVRGLGQSLDELSSGTRVQLLLAVRVAFVEHQEEGVKLPLILDETLANSDDLRAQAIMEALERIGARGRQIFYLTAQNDEVAKWRSLQRRSTLSFCFIELKEGGERRDYGEVYDEESLPPAPVEVPNPGDYRHGEYGELLGIGGGLDPYAPAGETHLWFLVEDLGLLYALLKKGVSRWGQVEGLRRLGGDNMLGLDKQEWARLQVGRRALDAFLEGWKVGRGRPVTRQVLEASGAVSEAFIDGVAERNEELGGEAEALIKALERGDVRRFRSDKRKELEYYLRTGGYLDSRPRLSGQEIWLRVLAAVDADEEARQVDEEYLRRLIDRAVAKPVEAQKVEAG